MNLYQRIAALRQTHEVYDSCDFYTSESEGEIVLWEDLEPLLWDMCRALGIAALDEKGIPIRIESKEEKERFLEKQRELERVRLAALGAYTASLAAMFTAFNPLTITAKDLEQHIGVDHGAMP